jgi:virginiamycin B lyase
MRIRPESLLLFVFVCLIGAPTAAQTVTEFPLSSDACCPEHITAGPDGSLWFTESSRVGYPWKIARITTAGSVVDFAIEEGFVAYPNDIASGPDGNLWFTQADVDGGHSAVNRMTPAGVLTRFPTETVFPGPFPSFTGPFGVTAGPDGNLWVTLNEANSIGQFTPGGELSRVFSIPTPGSRPRSITTGPDGNLWFTEWLANKIGRITPGGVITEFAIPTPSSRPENITTGSDGNLWFTEMNGNNIGRITPDGVITEFPIPTPSSEPSGITAGPEGNLWFTESRGNKIGRITPTGIVTEFPIPTPVSSPEGITAGPDGNIWFTERGVARIGRLTLAGSPAIDSRILPVVGSTVGVGGSFFRTSVQLHNATNTTATGRVVFHPSGVSGSASDPALSYVLSPGQTQSIADLLPAMGQSGLGSADIEVTSGSAPAATVRVFNDAGAAGTMGFTEEPMRAEDALRPGQFGVLLLPADPTSFRFNVGVRTLEEGATATLTLRDSTGSVVTTLSRAFPGTHHEQQSASALFGVPSLPPGGSIEITPTAGAAIVYGATVDNTTGDPSLQIARGPWDY